LLGVLAGAAGTASASAFYLLGAWHRSSDFADARLLLIQLSIIGAGLGGILLLPWASRWFTDPVSGTRRLFWYSSACLAGLYGAAFFGPVPVPMPIAILVSVSLAAAILIMAVALKKHRKRRLLLLTGAMIGIVVTVFISAQARYYYRLPFKNVSLTVFSKPFGLSVLDTVDDLIAAVETSLDFDTLPETALIDQVHIRTEPGSLEAMVSRLPQSAKEKYYRASMRYPDGRWRKIKYRLRGRSPWHWMPEKPSLRLKLRKPNPLGLQRHINLINPEDRAMVANIYGEELARNFGVMTHISKFVRLYINDKYFGVYHQATREDEGMMLANRRVPGPLFGGEFLGEKDLYSNWQNEPRFWRREHFKISGETDYLKQVDPLGQLLDAIAMPTGVARYEKLWRVLSFEKFAHWDAFMKVAGGNHTDVSHNHLYYFDPRLGVLEPVTADINGHGMMYYPRWLDRYFKPFEPDFKIPLNERLQPLLEAALRDPRFLNRRNEIVYRSLDREGSVAVQNKILDGYYALIDKDARADRHKGSLEGLSTGLYRQPFSNAEYERGKKRMRRWIKDRNAFLRTELDKVSVAVRIAPAGAGALFEVAVTGNSSARLDLASLNTTLLADRGLNGTFSDTAAKSLLLPPGLRQDTEFNYPYYGVREGRFWLRPGTQRYLFVAPELSPDELVRRLRKAFSKALGKQKLDITAKNEPGIDPLTIEYDANTVHLWRFADEPEGDVVLGPGEHVLTEMLTVGPKQRLVVLPGALLKLAPGVSIVSRGPVHIQGTQDNPVRIKRLDSERPWGGLLVIGPASAGSRISHAQISGGSIARVGNIINSGMVSIYGSQGFRLDNSVLAANKVSDDTLHVVYGDAVIKNTTFKACSGDCIDFDFVTGSLGNVVIRQAGNDGIDFMMSTVSLDGIDIVGAGDKGFSVGEGSQVTASGIRISGTAIAIAVKDQSALSLRNATLTGNGIGVDLYKKHWRYGGSGRATLDETQFSGNDIDVRLAKDSRLKLGPDATPSRISGAGSIEMAAR
jgi:hypothetical protein